MIYGTDREIPNVEEVQAILATPKRTEVVANRSRCCTSRDTFPINGTVTPQRPQASLRNFGKPTLRQTCSRESPGAPFAFKDSMIH